MKRVTLDIRWTELFGDQMAVMDATTRRKRWDTWKQLSREAGYDENVEFWSSPDGVCLNCQNRDEDWCNAASLPCTVNPILTFQSGEIGLACCGVVPTNDF